MGLLFQSGFGQNGWVDPNAKARVAGAPAPKVAQVPRLGGPPRTQALTAAKPPATIDAAKFKAAPVSLEQVPAATAAAQTGPLAEFDLMRKQVAQRATAERQTQGDALKRRFASLGALNSGAALKAQMLADEQGSRAQEEAIQGVNMAEQGERARRQEIADNRAFQSSEAARARNAQRELYNADMDFKGQSFNADNDFRARVFNAEQDTKLKQLDLMQKEFSRDSQTLALNEAISRMTAEDTEDTKDFARFLAEAKRRYGV